jgi:hypothetical protein
MARLPRHPGPIQGARKMRLAIRANHRNDLPTALRNAASDALAARTLKQERDGRSLQLASKVDSSASGASVTAARRLNRAAGVLAFSVLADSAVEHYRGSFQNRAMYTPLAVSLLSLAMSAHGVADRRQTTHWLRDTTYSAAILTGLVGTGFHLYNVGKRPGGFGWQNLFYGAPLGAPSAMLLSGLMGFMAERVRGTRPGQTSRFLGVPTGRLTAALTAAGLLGTSAEAALLHFRGAYHDPFMYVPVTVAPVAAAAMGELAVGKPMRNRLLSRIWLWLMALIGFAGVGFHAIGVHRNMGGWKNWSQNVLNGPPLPAPPSFAGLALAGLAALALLESKPEPQNVATRRRIFGR